MLWALAAAFRAIAMPSGQVSAAAANLATAAAHTGTLFGGLAGAPAQDQDNGLAPGLQQAIDQVQQDYSALTGDLARS